MCLMTFYMAAKNKTSLEKIIERKISKSLSNECSIWKVVKTFRNISLVENHCDLDSWIFMCHWKMRLQFTDTREVTFHGLNLL